MTAYQEKVERILAGEKVLTKKDHKEAERLFTLVGLDRNEDPNPNFVVIIDNSLPRTRGIRTVDEHMAKLTQKINCYATRYLERKSDKIYNTMVRWIKELKAAGYVARYCNMGRKGKLNWPKTLELERPVFLEGY